MKYISVKDDKWHDIKNELPSSTANVEFLDKTGKIISNGEIFIDMSGADAALQTDIGFTWDSIEKYEYWRFR